MPQFRFTRLFGMVVANVKFRTDYRFYALFFACVEEVYRPVHIAVVGYCESGHAESLRFFSRDRYFRRAVQNTVFGMHVQVYEITHFYKNLPISRLSDRFSVHKVNNYFILNEKIFGFNRDFFARYVEVFFLGFNFICVFFGETYVERLFEICEIKSVGRS